MSLQALFVLFVQTSVLLVVALVACYALRKSPAIRLLVCKAALVATLVMAIASPWLRERQRPVVPLDTVPLFLQTTVTEPPSVAEVEHPSADDFSPDAHNESHDFDPLEFGASVYRYGALLMLLGLGIGYAKLFRLRSASRPVLDGELLRVVGNVSQEFHTKCPAVRCGSHVSTVFVAGIWRPTLFLPADWASTQSPETILSVVRHEVAHIAAKDLQWGVAFRVIHILLWPQVFLLALKRPFCSASEELCDLRVLESGSEPKAYASALLNLRDQLKVNRRRVPIGIGAVTIRSNFGRRIQHILGYQPGSTSRLTRKIVTLGAASVCLCAIVVASVFAASKAGTTVKLSGIQNFVPLQGTAEVTIGTPEGSPFKGKAWILFNDQGSRDSYEPIAVSNGKVHVDFDRHPDSMGITLVAFQPGFALTFKRFLPGQKPFTALTLFKATAAVGQVLGPDKKPVANVSVVPKIIAFESKDPGVHEFLLPPPALAEQFSVKTDANGKFVIPSMPQNSSLRVDVPDIRFAQYEQWNTRKSLGSQPISKIEPVKLDQAAEIRGVVRLNGKPAPGIRVAAQDNMSSGSIHGYWVTATTDSNGRYCLSRMNAGIYNVALDLDSKLDTQYTATAHERVQTMAGRSLMSMNFDLIPGGIVEGVVSGPDGKPISKAQLGIYGPAHPQSSAWVQTMFTGADGKYRFHVPPGKQYVYMMSETDSNRGKDIQVADGVITTVNFQLK